MTQQEEIAALRAQILASPAPQAQKDALLEKLDALQPEEEEQRTIDEAIEEVRKNFIPKKSYRNFTRNIMKKKFIPILLIAVGVAVVVIGYKKFKKASSSAQ